MSLIYCPQQVQESIPPNSDIQYTIIQPNSQYIYQCFICGDCLSFQQQIYGNIIYCLNCMNLISNIPSWSYLVKSTYQKRFHRIYKHKHHNYHICVELIPKSKKHFCKFIYYYVKRMSVVQCKNCLQDTYSFGDIIKNYCPKCNTIDKIINFNDYWVIVENRNGGISSQFPKFTIDTLDNLFTYFTGPIDEYNEEQFPMEYIYYLKYNYYDQIPYELVPVYT
jgi:hypothetical protein